MTPRQPIVSRLAEARDRVCALTAIRAERRRELQDLERDWRQARKLLRQLRDEALMPDTHPGVS